MTTADLAADLTTEPTEFGDDYEKTTHTVHGALADRIRARFGVDNAIDQDTPVTITEVAWSWGTDWTRECETEFTVICGAHTKEFHPDSTDSTLLGGSSDSVFARFDAWLSAGDRPAELVDAWFTPGESCPWWDEWLVVGGSVLWRAATKGYPRARKVSLQRRPEAVAKNHRDMTKLADVNFVAWSLDVVAAPDARGFREILRRRWFARGDLNEGGGISTAVLTELTDELMPGERIL